LLVTLQPLSHTDAASSMSRPPPLGHENPDTLDAAQSLFLLHGNGSGNAPLLLNVRLGSCHPSQRWLTFVRLTDKPQLRGPSII
jgi:hypothetical protein